MHKLTDVAANIYQLDFHFVTVIHLNIRFPGIIFDDHYPMKSLNIVVRSQHNDLLH